MCFIFLMISSHLFSGLLYCKNTLRNTHHTKHVSVGSLVLLIRLLVNGRLFVVKFLGNSKLRVGFWLRRESVPQLPCCSRVNVSHTGKVLWTTAHVHSLKHAHVKKHPILFLFYLLQKQKVLAISWPMTVVTVNVQTLSKRKCCTCKDTWTVLYSHTRTRHSRGKMPPQADELWLVHHGA